MKTQADLLSETLWTFCQSYLALYQQKHDELPCTVVDDEQASPCEQGSVDLEHVFWQPVKIEENLSFANVEHALQLELHKDIATYFTAQYSASIPAETADGGLSLLFAWNRLDFDRLQENVIGHVLMKKQLKQDVTIFFAVTDEEDIILSMNNETGAIWAERVGCEPHKKLADNMTEFLLTLRPAVNSVD